MIRHFNYTGRQRIRREDARIAVRSDRNSVSVFSAELSLDRYQLPGNARVFVEAHRLTSVMRFPWGTVQQLMPAKDRALTEFDSADGVLFRVKVVEAFDDADDRPARLLALADQIRPRRVENTVRPSLSLLDVVRSDELDEVWKVEFPEDGDEPKLLVNKNLIESHSSLVRSEEFVSLVLPQVLRTVLTQILVVEKFDTSEDATDWRSLWLKFSRNLPGVGDIPSPVIDERHELENIDELETWVNTAVGAFVRKFRVHTRFHGWWPEGGAEMRLRRLSNAGLERMGVFLDSLTTAVPEHYPASILTEPGTTNDLPIEITIDQDRHFPRRYDAAAYFCTNG